MPRNEPGIKIVRYDPKVARTTPVNGHATSTSTTPSVDILPGTAYRPEAIAWIWSGWLARRKLHLLAGQPGTGKTTIAMGVAAEISTGASWPDGTPCAKGDVLIWSGEDGVADVLLPRLLASGGDPSRVHFVEGARENGRPRPFDPATDMSKLADAANAIPDLRLVILDPIVTAVTGDSHKNVEVRRGLQPVVDLAEATGCAVLGLTHTPKGSTGKDPIDRIVGSIAFVAIARIVWLAVKAAEQGAPRQLVRAKSNIGSDCGGFDYNLILAPVPGYEGLYGQRVDWGEALEGSARELMQVEQPDGTGGAAAEAEAFLLDILKDGPVAQKEVMQAAKAHGHKPRTVERAKKTLRVTASKMKGSLIAGWAWVMPLANTANAYEGRLHD